MLLRQRFKGYRCEESLENTCTVPLKGLFTQVQADPVQGAGRRGQYNIQ